MAIDRQSPALSTTEVLDRVLDKGIVIDAEVRIAVAGIELVTISAQVRVASFATWDRYVAARDGDAAARGPRRVPAETAAVDADGAYHVRLRCDRGCTFERRASTLALRDGVLDRQRCAVKPRRACAVTVV